MAKNKMMGGKKAVSKVSKKDWGLSGSLGLMISCSIAPALAHGTVVSTTFTHVTTPVTHSASTASSSTASKVITTHQNASGTTTHAVTFGGTHVSAGTSSLTSPAINLQSTTANLTLSTLGNFKTVTIDVGGKAETVTSSTKLTGAEFLAANQVANTHSQSQTLTINSHGVATGGDVLLNNKTLQSLDASTGGLSSLLIPSKVTLDDKLQVLNLAGDLTNYGTIDAKYTAGAGSTIHAADITNAAGATISGAGSLTLTADQTFSNAGTVKSVSDLTVNASTFQNTGAIGGATPTISAGHNLVINAPTVNNAGTLSAKNDVDFVSPQTITLQQTASGSVNAGNNINFRDTSYTGAGNIFINGGNLLSQQLNVYAPTGEFGLDAGNVTGMINGTVGAIHSNTQAEELILGNLNIAGDPAFYNTGSIVIGGDIRDTNGVPLAIIAGGNILSDGGSLVTGGGDLTLIAGTSYVTNSTPNGGPDWSTTINVSTGNSTGGSIELSGLDGGTAPVTAISTAVTTTGNGGNVLMIAYGGSTSGSGVIVTPANVTINTNGVDQSSPTALSTNGNVQMFSTHGIVTGGIEASTATGGGGVITLESGVITLTGNTSGTTKLPFEIINGQPLGTASATGTGTGPIQFGTISGFQATANTNQVGGEINVATQGLVTPTSSIYDGGIFITTGQNFQQATSWQAGGMSVTTPGNFLQTAASTVVLDGEGGVYNINAGAVVDFEGSTYAVAVMSPSTINVTTAAGGATNIGLNAGSPAYINADIFNVSNSKVVTVNGILDSVRTSSPAGFGNVSFTNGGGNLQLTGTGTISNSGTFTATASGNMVFDQPLFSHTNANAAPSGWVFSAGGVLAIPTDHLSVTPIQVTGNGGTVSLTYNSLTYSPTSSSDPFTITANGGSGSTGNGGLVTINAPTTALTIGNGLIPNGVNQFVITANSYANTASSVGGQINLSAGGVIVLNTAQLSNSGQGTGGSVTITPGTNLAIVGTLNESPIGNSPVGYGAINLNLTKETGAFNVGVATQPTNGVMGNLVGDVTINSPIGLTVSPNASITGNAISLTSNTIQNYGLIQGMNVGAEVSSSVALNTPMLTNNSTGTINAISGTNGTSTVSVTSPTSLVIAGTGTFEGGAGNTFGYSFNAGTTLNLGPVFNLTSGAQSNPAFEQLSLAAGTTLTIGTDSLATLQTTSQKTLGLISISAATVSYANSTVDPFTLNANGSTTGGITVNLTGTSVATQKIGLTPGSYVLQVVTAGNAAAPISFTSATGLSVNASTAALDNINGNLTLDATKAISIVGSIAQGNGNVTISSPIANAFLVGTTTTPVSGIMGNISGAIISITNGTGVTVESGANITGTSITLNAPAIVNNGTITAPMSINLQSGANLTVTGGGIYGVTGAYGISGANVNLGPMFATSTTNVFDSLNISASGTLTLPSTNVLQSAGNTTNAISISDKVLVYKNQSTTPLTLNTSSATGGGSVSYTSTGTTTLTVGGAAGDLTINTSNTGNSAATANITLSNPGTLNVNPNFLITTTSPADTTNSTNISLSSGAGYLLVSTGVAATGWTPTLLGPTGSLTILANTPASLGTFTVGSTSGIKSGIFTSTPITGGNISISNGLGSIYLANQDILQASANNGSVSLTAAQQITGAVGVETISAPSISLTSTSGTIGTSTAALIVNTPTNTTASNLTVNSSTAIYIQDNSAGFTAAAMPAPAPAPVATLNLNGSAPIFNFYDGNANAPLINLVSGLPSATTVTISAPGGTAMGDTAQGITTGGNIGNGFGVVTLNVGTGTGYGTITEAPVLGATNYSTILIQGTTVSMTAQDVKSTNPFNSSLLTYEPNLTFNGNVASGHLIVDTDFVPTTINAGTTNVFNLLTHGEAIIGGIQTNTGSYDLTSWGQILVKDNITSPGTVTLQTISGGSIASSNGAVVSGTTVNLDSDYGNISSLAVNAQNLNVDTTGSVVLTNAYAGVNYLTLQANPTSFSLVGNGSLNVASNLETTNGSILIQNNDSSGQILVFDGVTIHASSTQTGLGTVTITMGAAPKTPETGIVPGGVTVTESGGASVYFGSSIYPMGSIEAFGATVNADGRNVIFNSNGNNNSIILFGDDTITADPPIGNSTPQFLSLPTINSVNSIVGNSIVGNQTDNSPKIYNSNFISAPTRLNISGSSLLPAGGNVGGTRADSSSISNGLATVSALSPSTPTSSYLTGATLSSVTTASTSSSTLNNTGAGQASTSLVKTDSASSTAAISSTNTNSLMSKTLQGGVALKHHFSAQSQEVDHKSLQTGAVILGPDRATTIDTPFGRIDVAAKSLVILVATDKALSIYNFHDEARKAVQVTSSSGGAIEVCPGRHVTLSKIADDKFENVNPALFIPYRGMKSYQSGNVRVYNSEFHLATAIQGFQPLKEMMSSADHEKQRMATKVFKTIALLQMLSKSQGEFEFITPKPLTAYALK